MAFVSNMNTSDQVARRNKKVTEIIFQHGTKTPSKKRNEAAFEPDDS